MKATRESGSQRMPFQRRLLCAAVVSALSAQAVDLTELLGDEAGGLYARWRVIRD